MKKSPKNVFVKVQKLSELLAAFYHKNEKNASREDRRKNPSTSEAQRKLPNSFVARNIDTAELPGLFHASSIILISQSGYATIAVLITVAGLVQWQYDCFPSNRREFDSRIPLN